MGKLDENPGRYQWVWNAENSHHHQDLTVWRRSKGSESVVELVNTKDGVPEAIGIAGWVKCISCEAATEDSLMCEDCTMAIKWLRSANFGEVLRGLVELLVERPYILKVFEQMTDEVISEYFLGKIQQHRD